MRLLEKQEADFDFCFIDGQHSWEVDGLAVLLVERLLRPGGIVILDDLDWTYAASRSLANTKQLENIPLEERNTPQVRKVFDLLVKGNPAFGEVSERDGWGFAIKK
jgi:predicted O-methyltransferase YrrM